MDNKDTLKENAEKKLLSEFIKPMRPDGYDGVMLQRELAEPMLDVVNRFCKSGLIQSCDVESGLQYGFNVKKLQSYLRQRGLKVSGKKSELIDRLLEHDFSGMAELIKAERLLVLTEQGLIIVNEFREQQKQEITVHVNRILNALKEKKYGEAYKAYHDYRYLNYDDRPIVFGIDADPNLDIDDNGEVSTDVELNIDPGMDLPNNFRYDATPDQKEQLDIYLSRWPDAYKAIKGKEKEDIQLMAALMWIWGQNLLYEMEKKGGQVISDEKKKIIQDVFWFGIHECNPNEF